MSTNTIEQKRAHKAQQYFRDLLKNLRDFGQCDWPYQGVVYRVVNGLPYDSESFYNGHINALLRQPRKRGYKVIPSLVGLKDSKWIGAGPGYWTPQDKHILGVIIGEVYGPRHFLT